METRDYKRILTAKADELRARQVSKDQIAIERTAELFDEIQQTNEREMALGSLNRNWQLNTEIEQALDRIAADVYGICVDCEEPISEKRLRAIPWAGRCIRCQEIADRRESTELADAA